jgi:hypothetical protein
VRAPDDNRKPPPTPRPVPFTADEWRAIAGPLAILEARAEVEHAVGFYQFFDQRSQNRMRPKDVKKWLKDRADKVAALQKLLRIPNWDAFDALRGGHGRSSNLNRDVLMAWKGRIEQLNSFEKYLRLSASRLPKDKSGPVADAQQVDALVFDLGLILERHGCRFYGSRRVLDFVEAVCRKAGTKNSGSSVKIVQSAARRLRRIRATK